MSLLWIVSIIGFLRTLRQYLELGLGFLFQFSLEYLIDDDDDDDAVARPPTSTSTLTEKIQPTKSVSFYLFRGKWCCYFVSRGRWNWNNQIKDPDTFFDFDSEVNDVIDGVDDLPPSVFPSVIKHIFSSINSWALEMAFSPHDETKYLAPYWILLTTWTTCK